MSFRSRGRDQNTCADADQAELAAILNQATALDEGVYDERVASSLDDFTPNAVGVEEGSWQEADLKYDAAVGAVHEEVERRQKVLGAAYPFQLKDGSLHYAGDKSGLYEFLLAICVAPTLTKGEYAKLPKLFERVCVPIVGTMFRHPVEAYHVGYPRDKDMGVKFDDAMKRIHKLSGEWVWRPEEGYEPSQTKDEGVDFIIWPRHADQRNIGQLFVLGQCACGNDWTSKYNDLSIPKLQRWFQPTPMVPPVRSLATPHFVVDAMLKEATRESASMVFDRGRLVGMETSNEFPAKAAYEQQMAEITKVVFDQLSVLPNLGKS